MDAILTCPPPVAFAPRPHRVGRTPARLLPFALALLLTLLLAPAALARDTVRTSRGQITLPTYPWEPAVRHPYFRGTDQRNIYPYPMLDQLSRESTPRTYQTVILENDFLRVTFLPELGGKIHEVLNKSTGQPMFYVNQVLKPGLIGQCGAWTSGGVEWNTGPQGHTVSCLQPVDVLPLPPAPDGSRSVAIGETERIYRTTWTVVVTLRPGRSYLEESIRIENPTAWVRPYYFWNCTAIPNTPGFRFLYPMTLGTDHGGTEFYAWPLHQGKDLSRGTNYQDAASIFAYQCDQDFFGAYLDDLDRGVVAFANHHELPGKKAWTWGWGSYGTMHQMDLTDHDGPYNEVQTGPLPTQADVGRLEPGEAVAWTEWWYPVHQLGGFNFANRDLAAHTTQTQDTLTLRLLGTGSWDDVTVLVGPELQPLATGTCRLSPREPTRLEIRVANTTQPLPITIRAGDVTLARFQHPLDLPARTPPPKPPPPTTATPIALAGWQDYLFARFPEADRRFREALRLDPACLPALTGRATLLLDAQPAAAAQAAQAALTVDPQSGPAHLIRAAAEFANGNETDALQAAWNAALDPTTAAAARALITRILIRTGHSHDVPAVLHPPGPWQGDRTCLNHLALALMLIGDSPGATRYARQVLEANPLDAFAYSILWQIGARDATETFRDLVWGKAQPVLDLAAAYHDLLLPETARRILREFYNGIAFAAGTQNPIPLYWEAYLVYQLQGPDAAKPILEHAALCRSSLVFPHRPQTVPILEWARHQNPTDGHAALYLGHLQFHLGRTNEARALWQQAVDRGAEPVIALRALGLAALNLDQKPEAAEPLLTRAHSLDPADAIVARDLARVLFTLAERAPAAEAREPSFARARDTLRAAFAAGRSRADFVALLARAQNRLGQYRETADLLDQVRITIWEGAREAHDLFEESHLALGRAHLDAGRPREALAAFDRALEYPANLATGRLENTREAHLHYLRGQALAALNQPDAARQAWQRAANEPASDSQPKEEARRLAQEALNRTTPPPK